MSDARGGKVLLKKLGTLVVGLAEAAVVLALGFALLGLLARWHWLLDLVAQFRMQYFCAALVGLFLFGVRRRWVWTGVCGLAALVMGVSMAGYWFPWRGESGDGGEALETLKIINFNVYTRNTRYDDVMAFLQVEDADVVLLLEYNWQWASHLEKLRELYPHQVGQTRTGSFGIRLFSKIPFAESGVRVIGKLGAPSVDVVLGERGGGIRLFGTHPAPPRSGELSQLRNEQLVVMGGYLESFRDDRMIVAGDFNVSPFSPHFREFLQATGLRDSARGFGLKPTWNRRAPWITVPIDHVLVSSGIDVLEHRVGPAFGSDHHPVIVTLGLRNVVD
ncbi:MAG: endonuclease/exonuclease/phosphatase family protein [Verrucomicrobiota bacterium]